MNTEKLEKLKKSLDNKFIPDNMKEKIRAEIQKLEMDIKKDENITATEVKEEVKEIEKKVEVALEVAEKKEEQVEAKKPTITRKTRTKKTVEPKASTARKTRTKKAVEPKTTKSTSKTDKKSIYTIAKEIRKPNESWNDAVKRAGASMRGESKEVTKKVSTELQKLKAFVKTRKELKGISGTNLLRDSKTKGQPRGKRVSDEGNVYYEYRDNRTDRLAPNYPKNAPLLAGGGGLQKPKKGDIGKSGTQYGYTLKEWEDSAEKNGLLVSPSQWWKSQEGKKYKDSFGRTVTIGNNQQDKRQEMQSYGYRIAIGLDLGSKKIPASAKKYVEENNFSKYAEGGYLTDPTFGNFQSVVYAGGGGVDLSDDKYKYDLMDIGQFSLPENVRKSDAEYYKIGKELVEKEYDGDLDLAYNMVVRLGNKERFADGGSVEIDNVKVKAYKGFHGLKAENYFENVNGYDWNVITMKRYSGDLVSSARGGQHTNSNGVEMFTFDFDSPNIKLVSSKPSRVTEKVVELQHALALQTFKEKMESKNFADGGYNEGIEEDIDMTDDYVLRVNKGVEPKDRASMREFIAKTNESREAMTYELGGAFMTSDLAGNTGGGTAGLNAKMALSGVSGTHYTGLVGETGALSSGEMFAHGGGVGNEEKLLKELYKLQRELNSSRLQTYKLGDTSDEEMARQRERASKLERFNEVLKELNEKEIKYTRGGSTDHKYLNHSQDYEVRYAKGKNRHGYGNLRFANGGAMMANQQVIDDASQHYVNYYLNDGASAGMFKDGGAIKNQYAGRTPRDIWNNLSIRQRMHFLQDHEEEILEDKKLRYFTDNDLVELIHSDWFELDDDVRNAFADHTSRGEYAGGGEIRRFDRHEEMDGNTRTEILDAIRNPSVSHRLENYLFGLFDGYDYSNNKDFKLELKNLKSKDSKAYKEVVDIYEKVDKYNFKNYKEYATGGMMPKPSTSKHRNE
jgi:hypothetical protein